MRLACRRRARTPCPPRRAAAWPAPSARPCRSRRGRSSPLRELEPARLPPVGAGEGALLVPEELDSASVSGSAAQLNWMNGPCARGERAWRIRATRFLPVPDSPRMRTVRPRRGARQGRLDPPRRLGPADEGVEARAAPQVRLEALVLDGEPQACLEELLDEARVLDGDGREVRERLQERPVVLAEEPGGAAVVDVDRPADPVPHPERDAEERDDGVGEDRLAPRKRGSTRASAERRSVLGDDALDDAARDRLGFVLAPRLQVPRDAHGQAARDGIGEEDHAALGVEPLEREVDVSPGRP